MDLAGRFGRGTCEVVGGGGVGRGPGKLSVCGEERQRSDMQSVQEVGGWWGGLLDCLTSSDGGEGECLGT